jgi:hypothetical protein
MGALDRARASASLITKAPLEGTANVCLNESLRTDLTSTLLYYTFERLIFGCDLAGLFGILKRGGGVPGFAAEADNRHADMAVVRMPRQTIR